MRKEFSRRPVHIPNLDLKVVFPVAMNFESIWQICPSQYFTQEATNLSLFFFLYLFFFVPFFISISQKFLVIYVPARKAFLLINYINKLSPRIQYLYFSFYVTNVMQVSSKEHAAAPILYSDAYSFFSFKSLIYVPTSGGGGLEMGPSRTYITAKLITLSYS